MSLTVGAALDRPFTALESRLDKRPPLKRCCCCSLRCGIAWALGVFIFECTWHITISFIRPLWEWTSNFSTVFAFILQDVCRFILLVLSILACRALCQGRDGIGYLRALFRGLLVLIVLEAVELCFNAQAVHSVCDAPEVWAARERQGRNNTMDEERCELISNIYDFAYGGLAILLLMYISYVVHSYVRELRKKVPAEVATASIDDRADDRDGEGGDGGARRGAGGLMPMYSIRCRMCDVSAYTMYTMYLSLILISGRFAARCAPSLARPGGARVGPTRRRRRRRRRCPEGRTKMAW